MIKDISKLKDKSLSFIKEFINNCTIEEKIDTHYVIIEITSKQNITIKKASGKIIDRVDMILNNIWGDIITDWNYIKLLNQDFFSKHVGYNISLFYFPSSKPFSDSSSSSKLLEVDPFPEPFSDSLSESDPMLLVPFPLPLGVSFPDFREKDFRF